LSGLCTSTAGSSVGGSGSQIATQRRTDPDLPGVSGFEFAAEGFSRALDSLGKSRQLMKHDVNEEKQRDYLLDKAQASR
jgi:hypothetical protein